MATLYRNFLSGTITDNPLSDSATTINSANFASLPTITTDQMWLVLDPDGSAGAPEICRITAHGAAATSVTVAARDESAGNAQLTVNRSHVSGTEWVVALTQTDAEEFLKEVDSGDIVAGAIDYAHLAAEVEATLVPAGTIRATVNTSADTGWLLFDQTVVDAETEYPALWAVAPAAWKSGADLVLPDVDDTVLMAIGSLATIGAINGSNTSTALIAHTHTGAAHTHDAGASIKVAEDPATGVDVRTIATGTIDTGSASAANTGSTGSGTSFSIVQQALGVVLQIKAH
jgi:hypothetical protein